MPLILNGTTGVSGVDGSAGTPSYQGTDTNTGIFYPAADTIAFAEGGAEIARFDSSGNLGIGTSSPSAKLDVRGNMWVRQSDGSYFNFTSTTTVADIEFSNTPALRFVYNAVTEVMRMNSSGNVGIGTSSPFSGLELFRSGGQTTAAITTGTNVEPFITLRQNSAAAGAGGGVIFGAQGGSFAAIKGLLTNGGSNTTGDLAFSTRNATGDATLTERMRIDSSGNVGIGTSSPSQVLEVSKSQDTETQVRVVNANAGSSARSGFVLGNNSNAAAASLLLNSSANTGLGGANALNVYMGLNAPIAFFTNATERMRITSGGALCIAGTATYDSNTVNVTYTDFNSGNQTRPGYALGSSATNGFSVWRNETDSGGNPGMFLRAFSGLNLGVVVVATSNGVRLGPNATSWGSYSDERLKNITGEITNALDKVAQIRAVEYSWKSDEANTKRVGVIAQDVQKVLPEVVDADTDYLQVRYSELVPLCLKAIQEQQAMIEELKAKVAALEK